MGFFEILMVAVVAIIFLGPEKLPKALVDIAKFFKAVKKTMDEAKDSLEREVNLNQIKEEALAYKNSITQGIETLNKDLALKDLNLDFEKEDLSPKDSTAQEKSQTSTHQNTQAIPKDSAQNTHSAAHSNILQKKEIIPNKQSQTTLEFGAHLAQPPKEENTESQRNENV